MGVTESREDGREFLDDVEDEVGEEERATIGEFVGLNEGAEETSGNRDGDEETPRGVGEPVAESDEGGTGERVAGELDAEATGELDVEAIGEEEGIGCMVQLQVGTAGQSGQSSHSSGHSGHTGGSGQSGVSGQLGFTKRLC